jgi:hypothetical protein
MVTQQVHWLKENKRDPKQTRAKYITGAKQAYICKFPFWEGIKGHYDITKPI